jgi:hypothetical protein
VVGWWYGGTKGQAEQEVIAARARAMEEAARSTRQQTSIERQDRTYHGGAPSPGYHGVEPTLGGANVPHGSDSADTASQSIGRGYGMVCLLGATALATAVEVAGILLPGPDDALIAAAVGAKGGYRVIRGIVEGSKGSTREIVVVLSKEGKVLSRTELEALRKCGAPRGGGATGGNGGFSGHRGFELGNHPLQPVRSSPATIGQRQFSGHALDQMQNRGIPPSVVENTIQHGVPFPGNRPGTQGFYDPVNNTSVIINSNNGTVVTVRYGRGG